jgi:hypothetical protein
VGSGFAILLEKIRIFSSYRKEHIRQCHAQDDKLGSAGLAITHGHYQGLEITVRPRRWRSALALPDVGGDDASEGLSASGLAGVCQHQGRVTLALHTPHP